MNKTAIKNFAVWAREELLKTVSDKAKMIGISEDGIVDKLPQSTEDMHFFDIGTKEYVKVLKKDIARRNALVRAIRKKENDMQNYKEAFQYIVEEVAYTWFNRLIAIRFMEVNEYLPSGVRVLSSENKAKIEPDIVTTPFDTDLEFTAYEQDRIIQLKDDNKLDDLFRMLFIKQCNKFNEILPELFEKTDDFSELLLTISFTDKDGIVYRLTHDIPEDNFNVEKEGQVEIIGWMYQYYNTEPKEQVFANLKKNIKISKDNIPAATQLFTPDWIVRYMVENSLGRLVISGQCSGISDEKERIAREKEFAEKFGWKYYLPEAEQTPEVRAELNKLSVVSDQCSANEADNYPLATDHWPLTTKIIDPCMGSGHILVYVFDVLMQIYETQGYTARDAVKSIVENNLYGLDIDGRAAQLAYFAVMMKARQYDRRFFTRNITPNVYVVVQSNHKDDNGIDKCVVKPETFDYFVGDNLKLRNDLELIIKDLWNAEEYGSIINISPVDFAALYARVDEVRDDISLYCELVLKDILPLIQVAEVMAQKYDVVVTNPPYMGSSGMSGKLSEYVKKNYPDSKSDLFAVFMERCGQMTGKNRYQAMITQHAWMFLSSFEKLRAKLLMTDTVSMAHLGARAFDEIGGEVVQTTSFVLRKIHMTDYKGTYCRLIEPTTQQGKEDMFLAGENRYAAYQDNFSKIPGSPVAYWVSDATIANFKYDKFIDNFFAGHGLLTGHDEGFIFYWHEVNFNHIGFHFRDVREMHLAKTKFAPMAKGGEFRRWYGNLWLIMRYDSAAINELSVCPKYTPQNERYYFKSGVTWTEITSGNLGARYLPEGFIFNHKGPTAFAKSPQDTFRLLGFMTSKVANYYGKIINPTITCSAGVVSKFPIRNVELWDCNLPHRNITLSKTDWDSFENSWDFTRHPLVRPGVTVSAAFSAWEQECNDRFNQLKANEEELNRIFIDIYGLQDELTPEVEDKDVTVRRADLQRDIKSLISYAVGCMLGRYSLDVDGLAYAGGKWDSSKYKSFIPDADNCLPITDEEYFEDDIVGRFVEFIKIAYGAETLEENLDFIASALGNKGNTSREIIRNYFLSDFIKDHIKIYQKRPIYWLFDSGKQNGFKALVYMHRWNADTIGNMRVEYLHRTQRVYEKEIERMQEIVDNSHDNKEIAMAGKRKEKLQKQLKETKDYDAKVAHLALSRIDIDLDDGVKVNYDKVQTAPDGTNMEILAKI